MSRRESDLLAHINRRLRAADRSNTMDKLETLIAAVSAQIRADFAGVNLDSIDRIEAHFDLFERKPEPTKIDHPWTAWVAGDVDKHPIPGDTKIIEAAPEQKPADGEPKFIEWNGGDNPAPGKIVEYILRDGRRDLRPFPSHGLDWAHADEGFDIVGYRVVGDDPDAEVPEEVFEEVNGAEGIMIDALTAEEVNILNGLRRIRRHGIAYIETLQGPIDTSEGLIFPDQQLVENAKVQLGEAFDNLILAVAR